MQSSKMTVLFVVCVLMLTVVASAGDKLGIANNQTINFTGNVRIGDVLLPPGDYEVRHQMEGQNHVMIFHKLGTRKPVEARVKCSLVPLPEKSNQTAKTFVVNAANEQVLQGIVFRGDSAKHVF
ncbi:MAG: hypothetical protein WA628_22345 [Terriglobales bacterium]